MPMVVLGVTGCIAAYKACEVLRELQRCEVDVHVVMTQAATRFVGPMTFEALSHHPVFHDQLHNAYFVTRYEDITRCYFDEVGFDLIKISVKASREATPLMWNPSGKGCTGRVEIWRRSAESISPNSARQ